jgi:putative methyltransferase
MLRADKALRTALRSILKENGAKDAEGYLLAQPGGSALAAVPAHSRHVRVNTLKLSTDEAARRLASYVPRRDPHVSDLLVFKPGTDLHDHPMVRDGEIVLQGKASCLPAAALEPRVGWEVIDCCAAPGNKTTHLAALVGKSGKVRAFDAGPSSTQAPEGQRGVHRVQRDRRRRSARIS